MQLLGFGQLLSLLQLALPRGFLGLRRGDAGLPAGIEEFHRAGKARVVTLGPGCIGPSCVAPRKSDAQLRISIQARSFKVVQRGAFGQPSVDADRLRFFVDPTPQASPDAHQAFVRNVDDRLVGQFDLGGWHQERDVLLPKRVDDWTQLIGRHLQNLTQTTQPLGTANAPVLRFLNRQSLEHAGTQLALPIVLQRGKDLVGVQRKRLRHPADALIIIQVERFGLTALGPNGPGAHQGVLQTRKLVRLLAQIVEQTLQQPRRDLAAGHLDG